MTTKLDALIEEIVATGLAMGPDAIVEILLAKSQEIDWEQCRRALLMAYVGRELTRRRTRHPVHLPVRPTGQQTRLVRRTVPFRVIGGRTESSKVADIRAASRTWLEEQVSVGDRTWKPLRDCTQENLAYLVDARMKMSHALKSQASRYQTWLELMREYNVDRLGDLPPEVFGNT